LKILMPKDFHKTGLSKVDVSETNKKSDD